MVDVPLNENCHFCPLDHEIKLIFFYFNCDLVFGRSRNISTTPLTPKAKQCKRAKREKESLYHIPNNHQTKLYLFRISR